tara:strand:- start:629 stop:1435 length:807 start_codon:yes stop_codon:yes gene_type:complete
MGNSITLLGGFFLGMHGQQFYIMSLFWAWLGMSAVIASGCILNNIIDSDIDALMERTRNRPSVQGRVSSTYSVLLALLLLCVGLVVLFKYVNPVACYVAFLGWVTYVILYSLWFKRRSVWGTFIGGVAGAMPPVVGCVAVSGIVDLRALLWFALLFCWQIPHSYAIAIYREHDYRAAQIPVLSLMVSRIITQICMFVFTGCFSALLLVPFFMGWLSALYGIVALVIGCAWLICAGYGFLSTDWALWGRRMFLVSLLAINMTVLGMLLG